MKSNDIEEIRSKIDGTDAAIVELIIRRSSLAAQIGEIKHVQGLPVFRPDRHMQVYSKVLAESDALAAKLDDLPGERSVLRHGLVNIYREIMSLGMAVEGRLSVYSSQAARHAASLCFGRSMAVQVLELSRIASVPAESYIVLSGRPEELRSVTGLSWRVCAAIADPAAKAVAADSGAAADVFYVLSALTSERTGNDRTVCSIAASGTVLPESKERLFASADLSILDMPGYYQDADVLARIEALRGTGTLHVLGSYPLVVEL
jgi:chorismate mutase